MSVFNLVHYEAHAASTCRIGLGEEPITGYGLLAILTSVALLAGTNSATALASIYSFSPVYVFKYPGSDPVYTNGDGAAPWCTLFLSGETLYGTAGGGGSWGGGTLFKLKTDGSGFTTLHTFSFADPIQPINGDGIEPLAGLTLSGGMLYGTTYSGGTGGNGTVFSMGTNGDNFLTLHAFSGSVSVPGNDGSSPMAELVVSGGVIYGTASVGGPTRQGTLFRINTDGSGFATFDSLTNIVGGVLESALILSSNILYGTTYGGGHSNSGTVFSISTNGSGLTELYSFTGTTDGAQPTAGCLLSGSVLYGTTSAGGSSDHGTVFKLNIDGTGFSTLHSFANAEGIPNRGTLVLLGHNLFGITSISPQGGLVDPLSTNGTGFSILHTFTGPGDIEGGEPQGGLTASGSTLYGTTSIAGGSGNGTVFSLSLLPQLTITPSGQDVVVTWPTSYVGLDYNGFRLQAATNLFAPVWTTNLPVPVVVNGQNTVTNPISATQQFFRLSQ